MAVYPPPTETLPIFNNQEFSTSTALQATVSELTPYFLKFPTAQGDETLNGATVLDNLGVDGTLTVDGKITAETTMQVKGILSADANVVLKAGSTSNITFSDGTIQTTASVPTPPSWIGTATTDLNMNGFDIIFNGTPNVNKIEFPDGTDQFTAYVPTQTVIATTTVPVVAGTATSSLQLGNTYTFTTPVAGTYSTNRVNATMVTGGGSIGVLSYSGIPSTGGNFAYALPGDGSSGQLIQILNQSTTANTAVYKYYVQPNPSISDLGINPVWTGRVNYAAGVNSTTTAIIASDISGTRASMTIASLANSVGLFTGALIVMQTPTYNGFCAEIVTTFANSPPTSISFTCPFGAQYTSLSNTAVSVYPLNTLPMKGCAKIQCPNASNPHIWQFTGTVPKACVLEVGDIVFISAIYSGSNPPGSPVYTWYIITAIDVVPSPFYFTLNSPYTRVGATGTTSLSTSTQYGCFIYTGRSPLRYILNNNSGTNIFSAYSGNAGSTGVGTYPSPTGGAAGDKATRSLTQTTLQTIVDPSVKGDTGLTDTTSNFPTGLISYDTPSITCGLSPTLEPYSASAGGSLFINTSGGGVPTLTPTGQGFGAFQFQSSYQF